MTYSLAVDIGGTFTDVVLRRDDGSLWVDKTLTTHEDLQRGFFRAVDLVLGKADARGADVTGTVVHATTIVTNALIERKGSTTALIATKGFGDVLAIRNEHRYEMYDPQIEFAPPLIPEELTFEIDERVLADGTIHKGVNRVEVEALAKRLEEEGVSSVAISLINAFANPDNEREIAAILRERMPALFISTSSAVAPQIREYPRTSTTAVNAYTMPTTQPYLRSLEVGLEKAGIPNSVLIMLSSGGIIGAEIAGQNPVRMIESGPAAGALAASWYAERLGLDRLLSFDMGGTTAKACLIEDREPLITGTFEVDRMYRFCEGSGMPLLIPSVDMIEIGAGGGSIASIDNLGLLKVGPRSAGSNPGPVCYGNGGTLPTVTDADLVLGLLDKDNFLGGDMKLDLAGAQEAMTDLAASLDTDVTRTAGGIYRIVAEAMAGAARTHLTDRGVDYRGIPLLAFGGAGPVHACAVGELLGSAAVIFPPQASVLSAFGTLVTPVRLDLVRSSMNSIDALDWNEVDAMLGEMVEEAEIALQQAGCRHETIRLHFGADLRYFGQQNELTITFDHDPREEHDIAAMRTNFEAAYHRQYGVNPSHVSLEVVSWRLTALGPEITVPGAAVGASEPGRPKGSRAVALWPETGPVPVYDRSALGLGQQIAGPALIEERETTIVIPQGWDARINELGCIVAEMRT